MNSRIHRLLATTAVVLATHAVSAFAQTAAEEEDDKQPDKKYVEQKDSQEFFLRRNADDAAIPKVDDRAPDSVAGALFSFSRNFETDIDQTVARGVVGVSKRYTWNQHYKYYYEDLPTFLDYGWAGSVTFDKVDSSGGSAGETDILQFDLTADFHYDLPGEDDTMLYDSLVFIFKATDATDFDLDRHVVGGQLDIAPINGLLSGQMLRQLNFERSPIRLYPNWLLHAEAGKVIDKGGEVVAGRDEFARVGGKISVDMWFGQYTKKEANQPTPFKDRFKLSASYLHYEPLTADTDASSLVTAGAEYRWPDIYDGEKFRKSPVAFSVEYRKGEIPFAQKEDDSLTIGLSVRF